MSRFNFTWEGLVAKCGALEGIFDPEIEVGIDATIETDGHGEIWSAVVIAVLPGDLNVNIHPVLHCEILKQLGEFMIEKYESVEGQEDEDWRVGDFREAK